jgi:hypothetical protein
MRFGGIHPEVNHAISAASTSCPAGKEPFPGQLAPLEFVAISNEPRREAPIEIRDAPTKTLTTVVELISPWNKIDRSPAQMAYFESRRKILHSNVHLVEIDLLRHGVRPFDVRRDATALRSNSARLPRKQNKLPASIGLGDIAEVSVASGANPSWAWARPRRS